MRAVLVRSSPIYQMDLLYVFFREVYVVVMTKYDCAAELMLPATPLSLW